MVDLEFHRGLRLLANRLADNNVSFVPVGDSAVHFESSDEICGSNLLGRFHVIVAGQAFSPFGTALRTEFVFTSIYHEAGGVRGSSAERVFAEVFETLKGAIAFRNFVQGAVQ